MTDETKGAVEVSHDDLLAQIQVRAAEEYERQSDAGESAAKLTEFLDETGMNGQAFSWLKSIIKKLPKKNGEQKAMDVIRSLELGLPMIKAHVQGQQSEMPLDDAPEPFNPEEVAAE